MKSDNYEFQRRLLKGIPDLFCHIDDGMIFLNLFCIVFPLTDIDTLAWWLNMKNLAVVGYEQVSSFT